ncbi:MAG: hypothetical protein OXC07_05610, partial [Kistimonas sp.]|nr:hypothetical protein [Kistimonas sp.]
FSRDRFTAVIAPWMNRFDSSKARELERCTDPASFPELLHATLGEQLRQAPRLRLEPCKAFVQPAGIMVNTAPDRYELVALQPFKPGTREFFLPDCRTSFDSDEPYENDDVCLTLDQKRFVTLLEKRALIYEVAPENILREPAQCDSGQPILRALWSPCGQYLHTTTDVSDSVWARSDSGRWEEVIREQEAIGNNGRTDYPFNFSLFSPDSRSFILFAAAGQVAAVSWWCQPDGSWTPEPVPLLSRQDATGSWPLFVKAVFSPDSSTLALFPRSAHEVEIWHRLEQGTWTREASVSVDFYDGDPLRPKIKYGPIIADDFQDMAFNSHGQLALASIVQPVQDADPESASSDSRESSLKYDDCDSYAEGPGYEESQKYLRKQNRHIGVAIWGPSRHGWQKQAQIVFPGKECPDHLSWYGPVLQLFFSTDGRVLVADDSCRRVQAWCLLPGYQPPTDSLTEVEESRL